jgi:hypothetical protein
MSTPGSRRRLPSVGRCHAPDPVPPPRFPTALTACSIRRSRVCCTPLPARGSPRFLRRDASPVRRRACTPRAFPAMRLHTPRRIPLVGSRTASPRPLPSCRLRSSHSSPRPPRSEPSTSHHRGDEPRRCAPDGNRQPVPTMGNPTGVFIPLVDPARLDPPRVRLRRRGHRSSPTREPGMTRSPPSLAPRTRRLEDLEEDAIARDCSDPLACAQRRRDPPSPRRRSVAGSPERARRRPGHRNVPARVVSTHRGGGVAS